MNGCITPKATLQQVLQGNCTVVEKQINGHVKNTLRQLQKCRTAALGYHVYRCSDEDCGKLQYQYHSCHNRHCPQCGGICKKTGDWKPAAKNNQGVLFAVKAMGAVYKTKFLQQLRQLITEKQVIPPDGVNIAEQINLLYAKDWVVYAKAPFAGPAAVIEYLGRYTHKVATCLPAGRSAITGYRRLITKQKPSPLIIKITAMAISPPGWRSRTGKNN